MRHTAVASLARPTDLAVRLRARQAEIEHAVLTRVHAISDPADVGDPAYVEGLRGAVAVALEYGVAALEGDGERTPTVPPELIAQARRAARSGVGLDTVLRRYFAGYVLLSDFLAVEVEDGREVDLKRALRTEAVAFEHLVAVVTDEYGREADERAGTAEQRRAELVRRLLEGELVEAASLAYDFGAHHLALLAAGPGAADAVSGLAGPLDCRCLLIHPGGGAVWAWLGARRPLDPGEVASRASRATSGQVALALGEPAAGLAGWRLTHRQAAATLPVAQRGDEKVVRYADVALLASALQDDLLVASLRQLYLEPLERERDGGETWRRTLRAYFATGGSVTSAAAVLGTTRKTVRTRLRAIERRLGRPLDACAGELAIALDLRRSDAATASRAARDAERSPGETLM